MIKPLIKDNKTIPSEDDFFQACMGLRGKSDIAKTLFLEKFKEFLIQGNKKLVDEEENINNIFLLYEMYRWAKVKERKMLDSLYKDFFDYWGVTGETMPNYIRGIRCLNDW